MSTTPRKKNYLEMTAAELAAETARFNDELEIEDTRPLSDKQQAQWERTKRKRGRPRVGAGVEAICISIERTLLRKADRLAESRGISRAQLFSAGLVALMAGEASRPRSKPRKK